MMMWNKSVGDVVAEVKMMASVSKYLWIVEGPADDRFFRSRIKSEVSLVVAGGKRNVVGALRGLSSYPINSSVLGIVDSDIDWLMPIPNRPANLVSTDPRDVEGLLLRSSALSKVLAEFGDSAKISAFEAAQGVTVGEYVRDISIYFGKVRAANDLGQQVKLSKVKPQACIKKGRWEYDYRAFDDIVINMGVAASRADLAAQIAALPANSPWHYVRGHDAVNILTGGLLTVIGSGGGVDESKVSSVLRAGLETHEYEQTDLYAQLNSWCHSKGI